MIPMEALCYQNYGDRWYIIGDTIPVATEPEASDMEALRLARRKTIVPSTRDMAPEKDTPALPDAEEVKKMPHPPQLKRGQYVTRAARAR